MVAPSPFASRVSPERPGYFRAHSVVLNDGLCSFQRRFKMFDAVVMHVQLSTGSCVLIGVITADACHRRGTGMVDATVR